MAATAYTDFQRRVANARRQAGSLHTALRCVLCVALLACGLIAAIGPARADPLDADEAVAAALERRIDGAAQAMDDDPRFSTLSLAQRRSLVQFVTGSMFFILLHEMGHVHINEMALPVLGREEDSADTFAALDLLQIPTAITHRMLVDAAKSWFLSSLRDEQDGTPLAFYDDHGLDRQRAYWIVCLMVGSDHAQFKDLADEAMLPQDQRDECVGNYSTAFWSWRTVLGPHRRGPNQPKTTINVVYGPDTDERRIRERFFRSIRLLETVAEQAADRWIWPGPFTLEAKSCGEPNSRWNIPTRTLTVCYELAGDFARLYRDYGSNPWPSPGPVARRRTEGIPAAR